jgi:hypothetical protein
MIEYKTGDFTKHNFSELTICPHVVNNQCINLSGIVLAFKKKWPNAIKELKEFYKALEWDHRAFSPDKVDVFYQQEWQLGQVHFYKEDNVVVANMIAQTYPGGETIDGVYLRPIRIESLKECMLRVSEFAKKIGAKQIVTGKFGSLRAGGDWEAEIEPMIKYFWSDFNVTIYVYEE